ncbi:hypothetical protein ACF09J_17240 [Streptomyces sp. NPDC014889]|uniref:hypothetical protein n=1 Tax=Streptomyces sp. NPDC014889 TaxID=3364928 RepID=UPI0036F787DC
MLACGCLDPIGMLANLAGDALLSLAVLVLALVCLIGLLLGAMAALGHLTRRDQDAAPEDEDTEQGGEPLTLASFRWESPPDPGDPH